MACKLLVVYFGGRHGQGWLTEMNNLKASIDLGEE